MPAGVVLALAVAVGIGGLVYFFSPSGVDPVTGQKYGQPTALNADGVVTIDGVTPLAPSSLAAGMGVELNRYALARMIDSEFSKYRDARIGAGWAARNQAAHLGTSVAAMLTRQRIRVPKTDDAGNELDVNGDPFDPSSGVAKAYVHVPGPGDGFFGTQHGRYASSAQDASPDAISIADDVMSGNVEDPTGGARQFDSPGAFGIQAGTSSADADTVAQARIAAGNELVVLPGVPASYARFWRPV
jgi:hypothetical protein